MTTAFKTSKRGQPKLATSYSPVALALELEAFQHRKTSTSRFCLLPGTELSFAYEVRRSRLWPWSKNIVHHKTAIFRQVNVDCLHAHHDALEFPDGDMLLLTYLMEGQEAVVFSCQRQVLKLRNKRPTFSPAWLVSKKWPLSTEHRGPLRLAEPSPDAATRSPVFRRR